MSDRDEEDEALSDSDEFVSEHTTPSMIPPYPFSIMKGECIPSPAYHGLHRHYHPSYYCHNYHHYLAIHLEGDVGRRPLTDVSSQSVIELDR